MKIIVVAMCALLVQVHVMAQVSVTWRPILPMMSGSAKALAIPDSSTFIVVGSESASCRSIDSGKTWLNCNFPSGTQWFDVASLTDGVVIAVGNNGNVARSEDVGVTWTFDRVPLPLDLYHIWTDEERMIVATGDSGAIVRSIDAGRTWTSVQNPARGAIPALTMSPAGRLFGFDTAGTIIYSDDIGTSWNSALRDTSWRITGMIMVSQDSGVAIGTYKGVTCTTDGGLTWNSVQLHKDSTVEVYSPPSRSSKSLLHYNSDGTVTAIANSIEYFVSDNTLRKWRRGIIPGSNRNTRPYDLMVDGENRHWVTTTNEIMAVTFPLPQYKGILLPYHALSSYASLLTRSGLTAMYSSQRYDDYYYTKGMAQVSEDMGQTVQLRPVAGVDVSTLVSIREFGEVGKDRWVILGLEEDRPANRVYYRLFATEDAGQTWKSATMKNLPENIYSVSAHPDGHFCVSDVTYLYTANNFSSGVLQRREVDSGYGCSPIHGVYSAGPDLFFAYGLPGTIFRTNDTAQILQSVSLPTTQAILAMSFADSVFGVCIGRGGAVLKTEDAGRTWEIVNESDTINLIKVNVLNRSMWLVADYVDTVRLTTDGGRSWINFSIPKSVLNRRIEDCLIMNETEFLVSAGGYIYHGRLNGNPSSVNESEVQTKLNQLVISPNPATNSATVTVSDSSPMLQLFDAAGRHTTTYNVVNGHVLVNTAGLATGTYYLVSGTASGMLTVRR